MVVSYRVLLKPAAERAIKALDKPIQTRIVARLDALARNPRPNGAEQLKGGDGLLRLRVGDYRIIYSVSDEAITILVVRVGHRREVYR